MIFCPATPSPDETAVMIYGARLAGSSSSSGVGSDVSARPRQTQPKLGYSQNVKGLSQANKFNQGLTSLRVVLISVSSLPPRQTQPCQRVLQRGERWLCGKLASPERKLIWCCTLGVFTKASLWLKSMLSYMWTSILMRHMWYIYDFLFFFLSSYHSMLSISFAIARQYPRYTKYKDANQFWSACLLEFIEELACG